MKRIRRKLALNKQTAVILVFLPKSKIDKEVTPMKNRYEKIRNIGIIYRQARQRANNLCRREFYPFYNRIKVPDIVDKILKLKNS